MDYSYVIHSWRGGCKFSCTPPPVELKKYHESAVDSEDNVTCTRDRVAHEKKFTECLKKRHRSTAEYFYMVTQSAVESEDAKRGFRTLSGYFEQVTRPQNKLHDVIDMDRNVSCEQYISKRHSSVRKENQFGNLKDVSF
jgi:hypothetical protein